MLMFWLEEYKEALAEGKVAGSAIDFRYRPLLHQNPLFALNFLS